MIAADVSQSITARPEEVTAVEWLLASSRWVARIASGERGQVKRMDEKLTTALLAAGVRNRVFWRRPGVAFLGHGNSK